VKLTEKQYFFGQMLGVFIIWLNFSRYRYSLRELQRGKEQQEFYVKIRASKTMDSRHLSALAIDIILFDENWQPIWDVEAYRPLGVFWKSLDKKNIWGGDWKDFVDAVHFEYGG